MNKLKSSSLHRFVFFLSVFLLPVMDVNAQDYLLFYDGFENNEDSSWTLKKARRIDKQSYMGQKSLEVSGFGEVSRILEIPEGVNEILIKGWMKLSIPNSKNDKNKTFNNNNYSSGDTAIAAPRTYRAAILSVEGYNDASGKKSLLVNDGEINFLNKNTLWTNFEREVKIPAGIRKIKIVCRNTIENGTAYLDEIEVEKRQLGFVRKESSWSRSVKAHKTKSSLLVKNGDFEDGGSIWNPYWGFELSGVAHTGQYACLIQNNEAGKWRGTGNDKLFKIPAGTKKLKISAWIKAENVVGSGNAWETGAILLSLTDNHGNEVPGGDAVARTVGTHDWRKFESYFTVSERATNFKIALQLAASTGKIYFDDIVAEPMTDEAFYLVNIYLKNPGFENLLSGWPTYAGEATQEEAHTGKYSLKVGGETAAWDMRMQTVSLVRGKKELTFSIWMKTVNVTETPNSWEGARTYIEFKDVNGISLNTESVGRAVGNKDWEKFTAKIAIPEDAVEFTISCGRANVAGNAYFDDASLEY